MFEFLFKYSPVVFKQGAIGFKMLPGLFGWVIVLALLGVLVWLGYRKTTLPVHRGLKAALLTMKIVVLLVLAVVALEPFISVSTVVPRKSSILLLVDDSKSMTIQDVDNRSRKAYVQKLLGTRSAGGLYDQLSRNFKLQTYRFDDRVDPLADIQQLTTEGDLTDLAAGLRFAQRVARQTAIAGVVLFTDGADNSKNDPLEVAASLKANKLPVYVVGVGDENMEDIELSKVTANRSVIENSVVELSALIKKSGLKDREVELELREEGVIVKQMKLPLRGAVTQANLEFSPLKKGLVHYSLRIYADADEPIKENNVKNFLVDNRVRQARILYVEGYPRAEFKYLRRAVDGDASIDLVTLLRTGPDKFYRQGIKDEDELREGYPKNKRDLFKYDGIIFGSIEADFFTREQLANTEAFVAQRGGGFLMIGGARSFTQGGYSGTEIEKMLPVELLPLKHGANTHLATFRDKFKLILTPEGQRFPVLKLTRSDAENTRVWENLPDLEGYNLLGRAKPGATILAIHPLSELGNPKIIMAEQRFGRGRSMVFATASSWLWQMGLPHEDMSHERFWRQVLRWLALPAPQQIECHPDKETYAPGEDVTLKVEVRDESFAPINRAKVEATLKTPSGKSVPVLFNWSSNGKVQYIGNVRASESGVYSLDVRAYDAEGNPLGNAESAFIVEPSRAEFISAGLQTSQLKRIADLSGGKYYHQDEAGNLPDEIAVMESSYSRIAEYDLWDMPFIFMLVLVVLSLEWLIRRSKGLS